MNTKLKHNRYLFEFFLIGMFFLDLFTQIIPMMPITFAIIAWQFIRLDYNSNIVNLQHKVYQLSANLV